MDIGNEKISVGFAGSLRSSGHSGGGESHLVLWNDITAEHR